MSDLAFISPMPGRPSRRALEVLAIARLAPDPAGIVPVVGRDRRAQRLDLGRHRAREAVQGGPLTEGRVELARIHRGDLRGIEVAEPAPELERAAERLLDGHLLIEREPDQQRERLVGEESVGFLVAGERAAKWAGSSPHGSP